MPTLKEPLIMIDYFKYISGSDNIIVALIGGTFAVLGIWLTGKIKNSKSETDNCIKALAKVEKTVICLKISLKTERKHRGIVEGNWEAFKTAFYIVYDEIERKGHSEGMGMLKNLRNIIEK